jgi:hypothetical protein
MITKRALRWCGAAALVLTAWSAVMLVMPLVGPSGRTVAMVGSGPDAIARVIAAGGTLVDVREHVVLARGGPGFAASLYRAGAPLVIEGRLAGGCGGGAKAGA